MKIAIAIFVVVIVLIVTVCVMARILVLMTFTGGYMCDEVEDEFLCVDKVSSAQADSAEAAAAQPNEVST